MTDKRGKDKRTTKSLSDDDIVTSPSIGRRSALGRIGRGVIGGGALGLSPKLAAAQGADLTDVSRIGDPAGDNDSGAGADRPSDTDIAVLADRVATFDNDVTRLGDPADRDAQPFADAGDNDVAEVADRKTTGTSDRADIDITTRGDPIPAVDIDPTDPGGDADLSSRADVADQD